MIAVTVICPKGRIMLTVTPEYAANAVTTGQAVEVHPHAIQVIDHPTVKDGLAARRYHQQQENRGA